MHRNLMLSRDEQNAVLTLVDKLVRVATAASKAADKAKLTGDSPKKPYKRPREVREELVELLKEIG